MKICPECDGYYQGSTCKDCGYAEPKTKKSKSRNCKWNTEGRRCQMPATISYSTKGDFNGYCLWHFDCIGEPMRATNQKEFARMYPFKDYGRAEEFWLKTQGYYDGHPRPPKPPEIGWNAGDENQLKGLLLLGTKSKAWEKAPDSVKHEALKLKQSGFKPKPIGG